MKYKKISLNKKGKNIALKSQTEKKDALH